MEKAVLERLLEVHDTAREDPTYLALLREYRSLDRQLLDLLEELPPEQADLLCRYTMSCADLHQRLMELALRR